MGSDAVVDFISGTVAGAAQLVVGHPFDTIKVKLQSQPKPALGELPQFAGAFDATRKTLASDGIKGLFKGMGAPLATVALFNAVLFATRGQMEKLLAHSDGSPLTVGDQFVAGMGAGVAVSFLACPTELLKCRLQAQGDAAKAAEAAEVTKVRYRGPFDVLKHVRAEKGTLGLFKGFTPTLVREVTGNAVMFGVYDYLKRQLAAAQGLKDTKELGVGSLVLAGGLGGAAYWGPVYPADVIKSRMQVDDLRNPQYRGMLDCFSKTVKAEGVGGLYRGFGPALARSFPANGACFLVYELVSSSLK